MQKKHEKDRQEAIDRYLAGERASEVWRSLGYSKRWLYKWLSRYKKGEDKWYDDESRRPCHSPGEVTQATRDAIKLVRLGLYNQDLFCGAQAIQWELDDLGVTPRPSLRTINRVLKQEGLTHRRTGRYEPKGTPYPDLSSDKPNQRQQADFVGPRHLKGAVRFYSLNAVDLATGRCRVEPLWNRKSQSILDGFWAIWSRLGIPQHLQVDNDSCFYGNPTHPRGMGALIRLCLNKGIQIWFIPPSEPWRNGVVEKFNDHYEQKVLRSMRLTSREDLLDQSRGFEKKHNQRYRYSKLSGKTPSEVLAESPTQLCYPSEQQAPRHPLKKPEQGKYHLIRFIRSDLQLNLFGEKFRMPPELEYQYIVVTVDVGEQKLKIYQEGVQLEEIDYKSR